MQNTYGLSFIQAAKFDSDALHFGTKLRCLYGSDALTPQPPQPHLITDDGLD